MIAWIKRLMGALLVLLGALSLVISLYCIFQVWRWRQPLQESLLSGLELFDSTLAATMEALELTSESLEAASHSTETLASTVNTLSDSLQDMAPMLDTLVTLVGEDFPQTISTAQTSLESAQTSARLIDSVLRALTIFNRDIYNPPVPLHIALSQVSASLDNLPGSLANMENSLAATRSNLALIEEDVARIAMDVELLNANLQSARDVISHYQQVLAKVQPEVARLVVVAPRGVDWLAYASTFIFAWLSIVQVGLFLKGWGTVFSRPDNLPA